MRGGSGKLVLLLLILAGPAASDPLQNALALYHANDLDGALPLFRAAVLRSPTDANARAWLAETLRRKHQTIDAVEEARRALTLEPCHSFAHSILASAYNTQYSDWHATDADSTWAHACRAVECDSANGDAWFTLWLDSLRRGRLDVEKRSLRTLVSTGFLMPPLLAYNRWLLRDLPENALLITNGDMDTYPALALQEVEGLRRDVAVVNVSLLNLEWYAELVCERFALPPVDASARPAQLQPRQQFVLGWAGMQAAGTFPRPITLATTVVLSDAAPDLSNRLQLAGPYWRCLSEPPAAALDTLVLRCSLAGIRGRDFSGPWVHPNDPSPIRAGTSGLADNVAGSALRYGMALLDAGRPREALEMARWAGRFVEESGTGSRLEESIRELESEARKAMR